MTKVDIVMCLFPCPNSDVSLDTLFECQWSDQFVIFDFPRNVLQLCYYFLQGWCINSSKMHADSLSHPKSSDRRHCVLWYFVFSNVDKTRQDCIDNKKKNWNNVDTIQSFFWKNLQSLVSLPNSSSILLPSPCITISPEKPIHSAIIKEQWTT